MLYVGRSQQNGKSSNHKERNSNKKQRGDKNHKPNQKPSIITKMAISIYLSINTLNVNGLNVTIKDIRWLIKFKKKAKNHLYAAYERLMSEVKTHTD